MPQGFSGNINFAIIAQMLCGNHLNNYPPEYLSDLFRLRENIKNLRGVKMLQVPKPNTTRYGKNSVTIYLVAITWNKISDTLRSLISLSVFQKVVQQLWF